MRPLAWTELTALLLISALLASPAGAQTTTAAPAASNDSLDLTVPQTQPPPAPPPPPGGAPLTGLQWIERPQARDFGNLYPRQAMGQNLNGRATIDCIVVADGRLDCTVMSEDPPGFGFGEATLRISRLFRVAPQTTAGTPTVGGRVRQTIRWVMD